MCRALDLFYAARAEGRTKMGYEAGILVGRAYQAVPWLWRLERALGFKPHTIGLWLTDKLLTAPRAPAQGRSKPSMNKDTPAVAPS